MYDWVENIYGSNRWSNYMNEDNLPLFKKEIDSSKHSLADYKFYIRHHSLVLSETVLYAISDELIKNE